MNLVNSLCILSLLLCPNHTRASSPWQLHMDVHWRKWTATISSEMEFRVQRSTLLAVVYEPCLMSYLSKHSMTLCCYFQVLANTTRGSFCKLWSLLEKRRMWLKGHESVRAPPNSSCLLLKHHCGQSESTHLDTSQQVVMVAISIIYQEVDRSFLPGACFEFERFD